MFGDSGENNLKSLIIQLKQALNDDHEIEADDRLEVEQFIEDKYQQLTKPKEGEDQSDGTVRALPVDYRFCCDKLQIDKGVETFNKEKKPYAKWLKDYYFPNFHPMPYGELQYPILTIMSLINCNAGLTIDGEEINKYPIPLSLGLRGTGKSYCINQVMKHYPRRQRLWTLPSWTGAAIRDAMHEKFCNGQPGICVFDNFNPSVSINRLGHHYSMILANGKDQAISKVSTKGSNEDEIGEYRTHCFKWITTIFDLEQAMQDECKEILRRCITLIHGAITPNESAIAFDWREMEDEYFKIWSDVNSLKQTYFPTLVDLVKMSPRSIRFPDPSYWEICQIPIALGVHLGIWGNIYDGINHFQDYFDELPKMKQSSVKDLFVTIIDQFMVRYYPSFVKANPDDYSLDEIPMDVIKNYIQRHGLSVSTRDIRENIPKLLSEYGYVASTDGMISFVRKTA